EASRGEPHDLRDRPRGRVDGVRRPPPQGRARRRAPRRREHRADPRGRGAVRGGRARGARGGARRGGAHPCGKNEREGSFGLSYDTIVILDFGAQYTQLIARRVREAHVRSVVLPFSAKPDEIARESPAGIILSGGPSSVYDADAPLGDPAVLHM